METHEFSIIASGVDPEDENFLDAFLEAGCDDATIAFQRGVLILDFAREAKSLPHAIVSAVRDVERAGAKVERVEPDPLVSLSEIAKRTGLTKAAISHYALGHRETDFPVPVARVMTDSPLWEWTLVARWMLRKQKAGLHLSDVVAARFVSEFNFRLARDRVKPRPQSERRDASLAA